MNNKERCPVCDGECLPIGHGGGGSIEPYLYVQNYGSVKIVGCINCGTVRFSKETMEHIKEIRKIKNEKVYETGRYNKDIKQLAIDFNNLPETNRDISRISRLYPDYAFYYDIRDKKIDCIWRLT